MSNNCLQFLKEFFTAYGAQYQDNNTIGTAQYNGALFPHNLFLIN